MEYILDTINLEKIERSLKFLPVSGVTSNPSIVKKEGKIDVKDHFLKLKELIGPERTLHIQVTGDTVEDMLKDARWILDHIGRETYIKVPVTEAGLQVIKELKHQEVKITATAIYTISQAFLAIAYDVDYFAPYYNRMENMGMDPLELITACRNQIDDGGYQTKILAASFKNMGQVNKAFMAGAQSVTVDPDIVVNGLQMSEIQKAVDDFNWDWYGVTGNKKLHELG